jgi:hypothetical protein
MRAFVGVWVCVCPGSHFQSFDRYSKGFGMNVIHPKSHFLSSFKQEYQHGRRAILWGVGVTYFGVLKWW